MSCALGDLAAAASATVEVVVSVGSGTLGTITNTATVSATEADPDPADNSSTEATSVLFVKGDLNSDLQTDLLLRHVPTNEHRVWLMNGTERLAEEVVSPTPDAGDVVVGADDFSNDQRNDLVVYDTATGALEVWLMNGATRVGAPVPVAGPLPRPLEWKLAATGDFNKDGWPDLLWRNSSTQKLEIWLMTGVAQASVWIPKPDQAVAANWEVVAVFDLNGDRHTDFLWYNPDSGKIVIWFMDGNISRITGQFTNPSNAGANNWKVLAGGDYGVGPTTPPPVPPPVPDSKDLVWRNATSGRFVVWHMDLAGNRTAGVFTVPNQPPDPAAEWTIVGPR